MRASGIVRAATAFELPQAGGRVTKAPGVIPETPTPASTARAMAPAGTAREGGART